MNQPEKEHTVSRSLLGAYKFYTRKALGDRIKPAIVVNWIAAGIVAGSMSLYLVAAALTTYWLTELAVLSSIYQWNLIPATLVVACAFHGKRLPSVELLVITALAFFVSLILNNYSAVVTFEAVWGVGFINNPGYTAIYDRLATRVIYMIMWFISLGPTNIFFLGMIGWCFVQGLSYYYPTRKTAQWADKSVNFIEKWFSTVEVTPV